jgi:hypothetical protein
MIHLNSATTAQENFRKENCNDHQVPPVLDLEGHFHSEIFFLFLFFPGSILLPISLEKKVFTLLGGQARGNLEHVA